VVPEAVGLSARVPGRVCAIVGLVAALSAPAAADTHPWLKGPSATDPGARRPLEDRIAPPDGFRRVPVAEGSFGAWLRRLPIRDGRPLVRLHDGRLKGNQEAHWAVIDIDTGSRNLQQCADAVMRLRAEYLRASGRGKSVAFDFTSGDRAAFAQWSEGYRPRVRGNAVSWQRSARPDDSYESFRAYLDVVFTYAGSASLERELTRVASPQEIAPGDVFIQGGAPGHAVLVLDVAAHERSGRKVFLLAQSYMPAQDVHVLRSPGSSNGDPWYAADFEGALETPEWTFEKKHLRRFAAP
jgi:hypothetical protein